MTLTLSDVTPVGLCIATQELFDTRRFQQNFCDHLLLRSKDTKMEDVIWPIKRELNSSIYNKKFLDGHKTAIVSNIDKILSLVTSRYANLNIKSIEVIVKNGKDLIKKVLFAENFEELGALEPDFKSKITLPVYELFIEFNKRLNLRVV